MNRLKRAYYNWRADVHFLSYPKSGRTWLRLMLAQMIELQYGVKVRDPMKLYRVASYRRAIPCIMITHDRVVSAPNGSRVFDRDKSRFEGDRVLLLIRDPRDVVVSSYFQKVHREHRFDGELSEFLGHEEWGIHRIVAYLNTWARFRHVPAALHIVCYEDLRARPVDTLREVCEFVGIREPVEAHLRETVSQYELENMRRMEREGVVDSGRLKPRDANNPNSFKTRSGKVGGYRDHLSPEEIEYVDDLVQRELDPFFERYRNMGDIS